MVSDRSDYKPPVKYFWISGAVRANDAWRTASRYMQIEAFARNRSRGNIPNSQHRNRLTMTSAHPINYTASRDVACKSPEFLSLNPNDKIPAINDPNGPDGAPIGLFESAAIPIYLAEKSGKPMGQTVTEKAHAIKWLMWQMSGLGSSWVRSASSTNLLDPRSKTPPARALYRRGETFAGSDRRRA